MEFRTLRSLRSLQLVLPEMPILHLKPEKIQNIEFVVQNRQGSLINWNVSAYYSIINDAVASAVDPQDPTKTENQNIGTYKVLGSQATLKYTSKKSGSHLILMPHTLWIRKQKLKARQISIH